MLGPTSSINNYTNIFGIQSGMSMAGMSMENIAKTFTSAPQQGLPTDSVTISSSANILQQFLNSEMQGGDSANTAELDLMGLAQLKQRGDMLASMLQVKMKNFETNLISNVQNAGLSMQEMHLANGDDGLSLLGDMPNKESFENVLGGLQNEFSDIARLAEVLQMLQQMGPDTMQTMGAGMGPAMQYAQQSFSSPKRPDADFVMHILQSGSSFSFE